MSIGKGRVAGREGVRVAMNGRREATKRDRERDALTYSWGKGKWEKRR